jgi:hypothetical protein
MKSIQKLGMGVLVLALSSTVLVRSNAKTVHNFTKPKLPPTGYLLHAAMQDNGPGTNGTEDYTIISYITTTTDTAYSERLVVDEAIAVWWDGVNDGFHADIANGQDHGDYILDNYLPPHSTFPILFSNISFSPGTMNSETITLDTNVTYL